MGYSLQDLGDGQYRVSGVRVSPTTGRYITEKEQQRLADEKPYNPTLEEVAEYLMDHVGEDGMLDQHVVAISMFKHFRGSK